MYKERKAKHEYEYADDMKRFQMVAIQAYDLNAKKVKISFVILLESTDSDDILRVMIFSLNNL